MRLTELERAADSTDVSCFEVEPFYGVWLCTPLPPLGFRWQHPEAGMIFFGTAGMMITGGLLFQGRVDSEPAGYS